MQVLAESAKNIYEELKSQHIAAIATIEHGEATPQLTVVYYAVDDDFGIRFATKKETRKHQNLQKNSAVQLLVFDKKRQLTIQVTGRVDEITDEKLKNDTVENMYKLSNDNDYNSPPMSKLFAGRYITYRVSPSKITMAFFLRPQKGGYDMFETISF